MYYNEDRENENVSQENINEQPKADVNEPVNSAEEPKKEAEAPKAEKVHSENGGGVNPDGTYRHVYAESWREPTYKPTGGDTGHVYSPNYYNANTYASTNSHINSYETKTERKEQKKRAKQEKRKKGRGKIVLGVIALILVCAIISSMTGIISAKLILHEYDNTFVNKEVVLGQSSASKDEAADTEKDVQVTGDELTATEIYTLACEQVVGLNTSVTTQNIFGQETMSAVTGSGFVISEDGYILTNYHVISYAVEYGYDLEVMFYDGTTYPGKVVGGDKDNDVALVKIDATGLNAVTFGSMDSTVVGETVYTVGNPLGELAYTMTGGIVSARDREIITDKEKINMFQIDAAVNSGNSGGPVYNANGEVIGIVTAKYSSTGVEGIGFAIPIDDAVNIATQVLEIGYVSKAQLGITIAEVEDMVSDTASQYWELPDGAWVYSVTEGSAANKAGLLIGDIITAVNGEVIEDTETLKEKIKSFAVGDTVTLDVFRYKENRSLQLSVTLEEAVEETASSQQNKANIPDSQGGNFFNPYF